MMMSRRLALATLGAVALAACGTNDAHVQDDSLKSLALASRTQLATQLAAQKDSLTRVVLQADDFLMHIDSSVSKVKGMSKGKKTKATLDPIAQQLANRKAVMARVDGLVARAQATAAELAKSNSNNSALRAQLASDTTLIGELNTTIKRQTAMIDMLTVRVDSLKGVVEQYGANVTALEGALNKAYYVVGTEDELVKRGVIVREGGANLIFAHPGRTLQISRTAEPSVFNELDQRRSQVIEMPDTTRRYRVVSRQSLDYATVDGRERDSFKGNLKIAEPSRFWAASRYLVLVEQ